jgi:beta-galactosidase GanA
MRSILAGLGLALCLSAASPPAGATPPALVRQGQAIQLVDDGKPLLLLAGELGNSSASSAAWMAPHWARLKALGLNTVIAPVSWELIEPTEGAALDFSSVDGLIQQARVHDLRLVLLWFGAWKNSMSTYAPGWVKRNEARFPRAQLPTGQGVEILSAFSPAVLAADSHAFAALMAHLKAVDQSQHTVVMVQVENEIGMLPVARDHSAAADAAFARPAPAELVRYLVGHHETLQPELRKLWEANGARTAGDWQTLFGQGAPAEEVFTAWHYARYADAVAAAGKAAWPLPMYVNAALNRPGKAPGEYPSGGPIPHLIDVWKAAAPHLDLLAPDIYFPDFQDLAARYHRPDNALFIPEAGRAAQPEVPANAFFAIGELDAIGLGPFAIDGIDAQADGPGPAPPLTAAYRILAQLAPQILRAQAEGRIAGFAPQVSYEGAVNDQPIERQLGGWRFTIGFVDPYIPRDQQHPAAHGGLIIQTAPDEYLIAGQGLTVTVTPATPGPPQAGFDSVWEGSFDPDGRWIPGRLLNGDETHQGRRLRLEPGEFQIQRVRLYRYR